MPRLHSCKISAKTHSQISAPPCLFCTHVTTNPNQIDSGQCKTKAIAITLLLVLGLQSVHAQRSIKEDGRGKRGEIVRNGTHKLQLTHQYSSHAYAQYSKKKREKRKTIKPHDDEITSAVAVSLFCFRRKRI